MKKIMYALALIFCSLGVVGALLGLYESVIVQHSGDAILGLLLVLVGFLQMGKFAYTKLLKFRLASRS